MIPVIDGAVASMIVLTGLLSCPPQEPPRVTTQLATEQPRQINNMTTAQLGQFGADTTFSHRSNETFITGGLTRSNIRTRFETEFMLTADPAKKSYCVSLAAVKLTVSYQPEIYIAQEFTPGSCDHNVTLQHEIRHVNTDIITLREFLPRIEAAAQQSARSISTAGPVAAHDMPQVREAMQNRLQLGIGSTMAEFERVRFNRQQMIDTRQEYLRMSRMCPKRRTR